MSYNGQFPVDIDQLLQSQAKAKRMVRWSLRWAIVAATTFSVGFVIFSGVRDPKSLAADIAASLSLGGLLVFLVSTAVWGVQRYRADGFELQIDEHIRQSSAEQAKGNRSVQGHTNGMPETDEWILNRVRPEPQPFGVSDEGAEHLAAQWLQYLGFEDAEVTKYSGDGGIDVETFEYVCQVKNYRDKSVSVTEIRELYGVAASERKRAILFTATGVTTQGVDFADKNGIALIRFDAKAARLEEINDDGSDFLVNGEYEEP